jgi:preprotein translocase subunit SecE
LLEIFSYFKSIMVNKIKLLVGFLLVAAGIAAFYLLVDKPMIVRIFAVLAGLGAAVAVFWTTPAGQRSFVFMGESVAEARKVVWPTRKETIQTTMVVFVLVVIMAAFLAVVDIGFAYMVQWLMGRSAS